LSDAKNHAGDFWERMREVCSSMRLATAQEQWNAITRAVNAHAEGETKRDDQTVSCPELQAKLANGKPGPEFKLTARGAR